jgi:hypothetical protein
VKFCFTIDFHKYRLFGSGVWHDLVSANTSQDGLVEATVIETAMAV